MESSLKKLLNKYNIPGPRYTSYPTVPAWTDDVGVNEYVDSLKTLKKGEKISLYFHLPFCESMCHYCGCTRMVTEDRTLSRAYTDVLLIELDRVAALMTIDVRDTNQVHFGGGTPNFFQPEELTDIMQRARQHFNIQPDAEIAIEMHPRTSTKPFCDNLKTLGFNRISLGVQDFDPKVQALINRFQSYEMTVDMIDYLRKLSFDSFNFDLVYGLPGQTMACWKKTLERVLHLRPNRLAVYSYAHVPWVHPIQRSFKDGDLPPPELKLELFQTAYETFTGSGYRLIGMDHFALLDDELSQALDDGTIHRNFMGYTTRADTHQIGFGMSSISFVGGNYFQNLKDISPYYEAIHNETFASFRGHILDQDDMIRRDLIMKIMCNGRVDLKAFEENWGIRFHDYFRDEMPGLEIFVQDNLLEVDERGIRVIGHGHLFLRNIAMTFDKYLEGIRREAKTPTFSKTV